MRTKILATVVAVLFGAAACSAQTATDDAPAFAGPDELLSVATDADSLTLDASTGRVAFHGDGAVPQADRSRAFSATSEDGVTTLSTIDGATGDVSGSVTVPGDLSIRAVAGDGSKVALMRPPAPGTDPWIPVPRTRTTIVVADPSGGAEPERFRLPGNLEPEAFSNDGEFLFVIQYLPPAAPSLYRVAALELEDGDVYPVIGRFKTWARRMPGTRLEQLLAPDGRQLYTLYSSQPAAYAEGYDVVQSSSRRPVAFVHVLNLEDRWAYCLPLPKRLWGAPAGQQAMATSPDALRLYVVDPSRDTVAVIGTSRTRVLATEAVDFATDDTEHAAAVVSPDGDTLYVGTGDSVIALDTASFEIRYRWPTSAPVQALSTTADGAMLYAAFADGIDVMDPSTGVVQGSLPVDGALAIDHVGPAA
jgi:hypothetical protein